MSEYYWDEQIEYLRKTRELFYNDDYLKFLVTSVWQISKPVRMVDYGCGYGYLGLKLMPLLPTGSSYTGIDLGEKLLQKGRELFRHEPYPAEFIQMDVNEFRTSEPNDLAVCQALLLHLPDPLSTLTNMMRNLSHNGRIICFEPHWISAMANYHVPGTTQSSVVSLGLLQRLYEMGHTSTGKDGNIGIKLPSYFSQLGLKHIESRVSDKVVFLDSQMEDATKKHLFHSLLSDGVGSHPGDKKDFVQGLVDRGIRAEEAEAQYAAELHFYQLFSIDSGFTGSFNMKITTGIVDKQEIEP